MNIYDSIIYRGVKFRSKNEVATSSTNMINSSFKSATITYDSNKAKHQRVQISVIYTLCTHL